MDLSGPNGVPFDGRVRDVRDYDFLGPRRRDLKEERDELRRSQSPAVRKEVRRIARRMLDDAPGNPLEALTYTLSVENIATQEAMLRASMERLGRRYEAPLQRMAQLEMAALIAQRQEDQAIAMLLLEM
jgi:hypothetical protein